MHLGIVAVRMPQVSYSGHRFPPDVIRRAVWLYLRFTLSFRDVEEILAERGIETSYESVRRWVGKFGPLFARFKSVCSAQRFLSPTSPPTTRSAFSANLVSRRTLQTFRAEAMQAWAIATAAA